jgi:hypothetical protein
VTRSTQFSIDYDASADVLYVTRRPGTAARGIEDTSGVVWRYDEVGTAISATILDFRERWGGRESELADHLSREFGISSPQMVDVIDRARATLPG